MTVVHSPLQYNGSNVFVDLRATLGIPLLLKCEGFNFARSIKLKAATAMVDDAEASGMLRENATLVESSSGNLGVALSMIAANRGYRFICVTDIRCTRSSIRMMEALGAEVRVISEPAVDGGLLGARIAHVRELCSAGPHVVWLNQYANPNNWRAHYRTTGPEILAAVPEVEVVFVGAGTTGTLMGCARYLRDAGGGAKIVAVDAEGSVTFGFPSRSRMIPGLGTGVRPAQLDESFVDDVVIVDERETVTACRDLAARGFLFGGSTGTVVSGARRWLAENRPGADVEAVAIAPDLGESYLDSVYDDDWVGDLLASQAKPAGVQY
ncbi:2,3-diaminopropionate biosynthesis protein SbnA [Amycolatopsis sp. H20-H5]|uniref:2,3-diaminopropionate biosynthesis protein SbnA n=1 Tax=Amycolatopsis sp. H20-H5 TaxID=3046309 RepID=UPI002DBAB32F|nr:2,3-diaminopropionate biosynthesis protein SbnA [Amycolatopsis sp. H20-H5]MEC3975564.1 2,3-diaminopropionate biosynthesis protein SbnA [Amycolatopsis sp. H20-H5]